MDARNALIQSIFFGWFAILLAISILRTIYTSPGNIPDDHERDMATSHELDTEIDEDAKNLLDKKTPRTSQR